MQWNDGYITDVAYTSGAFREQSPSHLNFACVLNGVEPVAIDRPFNYFELGCGQGLTANILAACYPRSKFYAADFMPGHIAGADQLAREARLDNLTLLDKSFAELAAGAVDLPELDFVALHGVYSWVSPVNRRHIVDFIGRYVRPGGIVYVSYNAMPGWAPALPLQRLLREHADHHPGSSQTKMRQAVAFVERLVQAKAQFFSSNAESLQRRLDSLASSSPVYLAHEYLNQCWQPLYHADVAREFGAAKLEYAGSSYFYEAFWRRTLSPEQVALIDELPDDTLRETVKDCIRNAPFRADMFVRGRRRLSAGRRQTLLEQARLALLVPSDKAKLGSDSEGGARTVANAAVLDLLAQGPCTFAQLAALPSVEGHGALPSILELAAMLFMENEGAVFLGPEHAQDTAPAHRLNLAIAQRAQVDDRCQALASPLLGNVVRLGQIARLVYLCLVESPRERDADAITRKVLQHMESQQTAADPSSREVWPGADETARCVKDVLLTRVRLWQQLKML
jgi:SAM-dependent methyltransferase